VESKDNSEFVTEKRLDEILRRRTCKKCGVMNRYTDTLYYDPYYFTTVEDVYCPECREVVRLEENIKAWAANNPEKVKSLMMLSGGERALTSIALLFAMSSVNPPPFIILDETDAALDEANSKRYGDMIENLSKNSQLILISHNRETMSRAGVIFGITMIDGASKVLSIKFDEAVLIAK